MTQTVKDILTPWKNNMDAEEKEIYGELVAAFEKLEMKWDNQVDYELISIEDTDIRKDIMKDYLGRLRQRIEYLQTHPVRPQNWSCF